MKLKRARLADDLNEKIAQRPGPMELVVKNILPVDSSVKEAIQGTCIYIEKMISLLKCAAQSNGQNNAFLLNLWAESF